MKLTCPQCKDLSGVYILYGLTRTQDGDLARRVKNEEIILGGCIIREETHQCTVCDYKWIDEETNKKNQEMFTFSLEPNKGEN